jgi:hypothetical protein
MDDSQMQSLQDKLSSKDVSQFLSANFHVPFINPFRKDRLPIADRLPTAKPAFYRSQFSL